MASGGQDNADALRVVHDDPAFRLIHEAFLSDEKPRAHGDIIPERALAEAKLKDSESIEDAIKWLSPNERMALLHDRGLIGALARLPSPEGASAIKAA
jgi:membrane glycosyltransferase